MSRRRFSLGSGGRVLGTLLAIGGAVIILTSLPRWLWLLALGCLLLWVGLLLASPQR